jgi:hypothetical protein
MVPEKGYVSRRSRDLMSIKTFTPGEDQVVESDMKAAMVVARRLIDVLQQSVDLHDAGKEIPDHLNKSASAWVAVAWTMYREGGRR